MNLIYKGITIKVQTRMAKNGKLKYKATAQIERTDAGAYPEWEDSMITAIDNEKIFVDNMIEFNTNKEDN